MALVDIGGISYEESTTGSGTGNYNSFLRLQATDEEDGVNTDDNNVGDNKGGIWTHSILLSSLAQVEIGGVFYYEIRLDLNEGDSDGAPPITLEDLRIFYSDDPAMEADYDNDFINLHKVYDLGDALELTDINSGSGTDDYRFLIPVDLFNLADGDDYFTLYSKFSGSDGGFEEWRVKSQDVGDGLPIIHLEKTADPILINEGTPTDITYTYLLTNLSPGPDALTITTFIDDNGTPGDTSDDVDLLGGVDATLSPYYVSGDTDLDGKLDKTETWTFQFTRTGTVINTGDLTNLATVNAIDEEGNNTHDDDPATVTAEDVDPTINIDKVASLTQVQAGLGTPVTFTYTVTNTSPASTDPITLTSLVDDNGTVTTVDDKVLLNGDSTISKGAYYVSGDDGDGLLETGENWVFQWTTNVTLAAGETRTNIVTVDGHDDEDNPVTDTDDASITAYNLGRTPGFWSNEKNGGKLWDGNDGTWPNGGALGTNSIAAAGHDLAYRIYDLNGDGDTSDGGEAAGSRGYLMIGDWDHDGVVDAGENVLVMTRQQALTLLNASEKQQQDGRWMVARDLVASWLNYIGGSYVGDADDTGSARHYIDEGIAWLLQTSANHDHVLNPSVDFTSGTKQPTSGSSWNTGFNFNGSPGVQNDVPLTGDILGQSVNLDILGGGSIHTGLDHYNNFGYV